MKDVTDRYSEPDVTVHGPKGEPEVTVIGGVHGDEPTGVEVIRELREKSIEYKRPIQLVIGNPRAVEECKRYVDADLNRVFPGDKNGKLEEQIASKIMDVIDGTTVLSIHTTHSSDSPFAILDTKNERLDRIVEELSVPYAVDPSPMDVNSLSQYGDVIEIEAGLQYSDKAVRQARQIVHQFLNNMGVLDYSSEDVTSTEYFEMLESVKKPENSPDKGCDVLYDFRAENFEIVESGEVYAEYQSKKLEAESAFYPILMSKCGYEGIFGFKGRKVRKSTEA